MSVNFLVNLRDMRPIILNSDYIYPKSESIRRQERDILLLQAMLDKVQPTIRRDCNYFQLHKIKDQSEWDGEKWILPQMRIIKESLPGLNGNHNSMYREERPHRIRVNLFTFSFYFVYFFLILYSLFVLLFHFFFSQVHPVKRISIVG